MKIKFCKHREEEKHDNEKFQENDKKFFFHFFFSKSFHLISFQRKLFCALSDKSACRWGRRASGGRWKMRELLSPIVSK